MKKLIAVILVMMFVIGAPGAALAGGNMMILDWTVGEIHAGGGGIAFPGLYIAGGVAIIFALIIFKYGTAPGLNPETGLEWQ